MAEYRPEKAQVAASFAAAAEHYDDVAILQRQTADALLERLSFMKLSPNTILDLGTGTGRNLALLQQRFPKAELIAMDIAQGMLAQAKQRYKADIGLKRFWSYPKPTFSLGDAEALPLPDKSVDLVFANLALQWCEPERCMQEVARVLTPQGVVVFSTLGPDTLSELRQAWASVDTYPHVNVFYDMHDVGNAMTAAGLTDCVLDVDPYQLHYSTAMKMMRDLKILGAHNVNQGRRRGLTGKQRLKQVCEKYESMRVEAGVPATYEVIFAHGWKNNTGQNLLNEEIHIPISEIRRS